MIITVFARLPMGSHWEWVEVPQKRSTITVGAKGQHTLETKYILQLRAITDKEAHEVLATYASAVHRANADGIKPWQNDETAQQWFESLDLLLGKLAIVAMSGNTEAEKAFNECSTTLQLGGDSSEWYDQLSELCNEYKKERRA